MLPPGYGMCHFRANSVYVGLEGLRAFRKFSTLHHNVAGPTGTTIKPSVGLASGSWTLKT